MSKFLISSGGRIKQIEKPITVRELYNTLQVVSNLHHSQPINRAKVKFNIPKMYLDIVFIRGNCCLLTMLGDHPNRTPHSKMILSTQEMWNAMPNDHSLNVFHYIHDLSVVRPVLSVSLGESLYFELGSPAEHRIKIIKGQYSE